MMHEDAKYFVKFQGAVIASAGGTAVVASSKALLGVAATDTAKKVAVRTFCTYASLCPHSPHAPNPEFNPRDPPGETQMGEQMQKLVEVWRRALEDLKQRQTTPTEPRPSSPPPPDPTSPPPSPPVQ